VDVGIGEEIVRLVADATTESLQISSIRFERSRPLKLIILDLRAGEHRPSPHAFCEVLHLGLSIA
jgi:hypothetical protein